MFKNIDDKLASLIVNIFNDIRKAFNDIIQVVIQRSPNVAHGPPKSTPAPQKWPAVAKARVDWEIGDVKYRSILVDEDWEGSIDADGGGCIGRGGGAGGRVEVDINVRSEGGVGHQGDDVVVHIRLQLVKVDEDPPKNQEN